MLSFVLTSTICQKLTRTYLPAKKKMFSRDKCEFIIISPDTRRSSSSSSSSHAVVCCRCCRSHTHTQWGTYSQINRRRFLESTSRSWCAAPTATVVVGRSIQHVGIFRMQAHKTKTKIISTHFFNATILPGFFKSRAL